MQYSFYAMPEDVPSILGWIDLYHAVVEKDPLGPRLRIPILPKSAPNALRLQNADLIFDSGACWCCVYSPDAIVDVALNDDSLLYLTGVSDGVRIAQAAKS